MRPMLNTSSLGKLAEYVQSAHFSAPTYGAVPGTRGRVPGRIGVWGVPREERAGFAVRDDTIPARPWNVRRWCRCPLPAGPSINGRCPGQRCMHSDPLESNVDRLIRTCTEAWKSLHPWSLMVRAAMTSHPSQSAFDPFQATSSSAARR